MCIFRFRPQLTIKETKVVTLSFVYEYEPSLNHYYAKDEDGMENEFAPNSNFITTIQTLLNRYPSTTQLIVKVDNSVEMDTLIQDELNEEFIQNWTDEDLEKFLHFSPHSLVGHFNMNTLHVDEDTSTILCDILAEKIWDKLTPQNKLQLILQQKGVVTIDPSLISR